MKKQEAKAYFEKSRSYYETGDFKMALHGALDVLKEVKRTLRGKLQEDGDHKTGTLLVDSPINSAVQIMEWIDFAAEHPELEIAVTGVVCYLNSGETGTFAWYSPAGSPELDGTCDDAPIGGECWPDLFASVDEEYPPFPSFRNLCRVGAPLGLWREEDHDDGWVAVWKNARGDLGYTDLLDRERLERYSVEYEGPIPPGVEAAVDLVSELDGLEAGPEGEEVILKLWKILFPEAEIRIEREEDRCRFLDSAGSEYFLAVGYFNETADGGAYFGRYVCGADRIGDDPLDWGFPPTTAWIPKALFTYEKLSDEDEELSDEEDW